jgi:predicted DCC family thiol-disulfide oxidoreductase YuxK
MILAGARLGGPGWVLQPLRLLPRPAQDWLYRRLARNRYRLFGRTDICALPDPELRARLIE